MLFINRFKVMHFLPFAVRAAACHIQDPIATANHATRDVTEMKRINCTHKQSTRSIHYSNFEKHLVARLILYKKKLNKNK